MLFHKNEKKNNKISAAFRLLEAATALALCGSCCGCCNVAASLIEANKYARDE